MAFRPPLTRALSNRSKFNLVRAMMNVPRLKEKAKSYRVQPAGPADALSRLQEAHSDVTAQIRNADTGDRDTLTKLKAKQAKLRGQIASMMEED